MLVVAVVYHLPLSLSLSLPLFLSPLSLSLSFPLSLSLSLSLPSPSGLSPYHLSLPKKNSLLSSSVDSIVTITTLAEDDIETIVGQVAGWCGSFDKLLEDPLGVKCFEVSHMIIT